MIMYCRLKVGGGGGGEGRKVRVHDTSTRWVVNDKKSACRKLIRRNESRTHGK